MAEFVTDVGQLILNVHVEKDCEGHNCCIHNPSDHHMREWPLKWRHIGYGGRGHMVRLCAHGVSHPDPDDVAFYRRLFGDDVAEDLAEHHCDHCCIDLDPGRILV